MVTTCDTLQVDPLGDHQQSSVALAGSEPWNQRDVGIGYAGMGSHGRNFDVSHAYDQNQHVDTSGIRDSTRL